MFPFPEMQSSSSTTSFFTAYAQFAAVMMLIRSMANQIIPHSVQSYIYSLIKHFFAPLSNNLTIVIDDNAGIIRNQIYESAEIYLSTKISPTTDRFKVTKIPKQTSITISMEKDQEITDVFREFIVLKWRFVLQEAQQESRYHTPEKRRFELTFKKRYKETVMNDYLPFILAKAKEIKAEERAIRLYTRDCPNYDDDYSNNGGGGGGVWGSINLDHPATFDTLAMDSELKKTVIDDLDRFMKRKDYYKKVGKAWKRGYLLYGPPGTGKSSLVAAMANYLKFDIYDLELTSLFSDSDLRRVLVTTTNRSILVIEDIDCSIEMQDRNLDKDDHYGYDSPTPSKLTLSGLLNFIDGLWSSCGDERIIVFTTNYKEKLDPALLRPGRMDMHIHMSYCTSQGFKTLASNYLDIENVEDLTCFSEIERLIDQVEVTPAEIAEGLMRSEDTDLAMEGVVDFLKRKKVEAEEMKKNGDLQGQHVQEENGIAGSESDAVEDEEMQMPMMKPGLGRGVTRRNVRNNVHFRRGSIRTFRSPTFSFI